MDILDIVKEEYGLREVSWMENPFILLTDSGCKRIRYWADESLLKWHTEWRDEAGKKDGPMLDRMIRTKKGESRISVNKQWITLHDSCIEPFGLLGNEKQWGALVAKILAAGEMEARGLEVLAETDEFDFQSLLELAKPVASSGGSFSLIRMSLTEARKRAVQANKLIELAGNSVPPLLDPQLSTDSGRKVMDFLFYEAGDQMPVRTYKPLRRFLQEWIAACGTPSLKRLLTAADRDYPLHSEQGFLLAAEIMIPWELKECLLNLQGGDLEEAVSSLDRFSREWEINRRLLMAVTEWMDENRKKVAL
ncbi:hypothetical protein ACFFJY_06860 [Fictibacillus aquaticus]|uniref:Uncharacterized protein n=1 Tax=Fictibacillus aquaticus TaxID=2021314 RepID=A0A235F9S6_9BACL|nr:hypothetical protein [Fictibacillus aquaticus]OYD58081.1 hypothetical protein CGZ90_09350 [Fictibacillus aquaticus]